MTKSKKNLKIFKILKDLNISGIKKLSGYEGFYRIRIGNYRIGFYEKDGNIEFLVLKSRGDFYKTFPKNFL